MAESDITWNATRTGSPINGTGTIDIVNSPTTADFLARAKGSVVPDSALKFENGIIICSKDIFVRSNASLENIKNCTFIMQDRARFLAEATTSKLKLNNCRVLLQGHNNTLGGHASWPFDRNPQDVWGEVEGGGLVNITETNGWLRVGLKSANNAFFEADDYAQEVGFVAFRENAETKNLSLINVEEFGVDSYARRLIAHNITQIGNHNIRGGGLLAQRYSSFMLNNWSNRRKSGTSNNGEYIQTYPNQGGDTPIPYHVYLLGTASSAFPTFIGQIDRGNSANNRGRLNIHKGGLRFYQVFKSGTPLTGFHFRYYRHTSVITPAINPINCVPTLDNHTLLEAPVVNADGGRIRVCTQTKRMSYINGGWPTETWTHHRIRIRKPDIQFLDIDMSEAEANQSIGDPDTFVPLPVQPDVHYIPDDPVTGTVLAGFLSFNFTTRTITIGNIAIFVLRNLWQYIKEQLSDPANFNHNLEWSIDGGWLDIGSWNVVMQHGSTIDGGTTHNGTAITGIRTTGIITIHDDAVINVNMISNAGVRVRLSSSVANTRAVLERPDNTKFKIVLPWSGFLPGNSIIKLTAKAIGYLPHKQTINTATTHVLEIHPNKNPNIDLGVAITGAEESKFGISLASGVCTINVGEIDLNSQFEKTKRLVDMILSTMTGLDFFHEYNADGSLDDTLEGLPIEFGSDRIVMKTTHLKFMKLSTLSANQITRLGSAVFDENGNRYSAVFANGSVIFDNLAVQALLTSREISKAATLTANNNTFMDALADSITDHEDFVSLENEVLEARRNTEKILDNSILEGRDLITEFVFNSSDIIFNPEPSVLPTPNVQGYAVSADEVAIVFRDFSLTGGSLTINFEHADVPTTSVTGDEKIFAEIGVRFENLAPQSPRENLTVDLSAVFYNGSNTVKSVDSHRDVVLAVDQPAEKASFYLGKLTQQVTQTALNIKLNSTDEDRVRLIIESFKIVKLTERTVDDFKADVSGISGGGASVADIRADLERDGGMLKRARDELITNGNVSDSHSVRKRIIDLQTEAGAIKGKTDKLGFNSANDVKSTLDGEEVATDTASRNASKADVSGLASQSSVNTVDGIVDAIKTKTDKLQFTSSEDVKATLDGEEVTTDSASRIASKATVPTPPTVEAITNAILNKALSSHTTAGTVGKALSDAESDSKIARKYLDNNREYPVESDVQKLIIKDDDGTTQYRKYRITTTEQTKETE